jgi:LuxR family transcriptional regulator, regulator of acetate metabolism
MADRLDHPPQLTPVPDQVADLRATLAMWQQVHAALRRLEEIGPPSELIHRAATEAGLAADLERVVLSGIDQGRLTAESVFVRGDADRAAATLATLRAQPVRIDYPLLEGEMLRRRRSLLVTEADSGRAAYASTLDWRTFVAAPVLLEGRVIGFFHGDRPSSHRPLAALDQLALGMFADGFASAYERAVLRRRLWAQRQEIRKLAHWADARTSELGEQAIRLAARAEHDGAVPPGDRPAVVPDSGADRLTRREADVLHQMAQGRTNADIAQALVISEGTVKFHVKNILRKLQVANRSEATAKYLRNSLGNGNPTI